MIVCVTEVTMVVSKNIAYVVNIKRKNNIRDEYNEKYKYRWCKHQ